MRAFMSAPRARYSRNIEAASLGLGVNGTARIMACDAETEARRILAETEGDGGAYTATLTAPCFNDGARPACLVALAESLAAFVEGR
jgi:hypothetical protein